MTREGDRGLIGREAELLALQAAFSSDAPLIAVHGVAGVGKSALVAAWCAGRRGVLFLDAHECESRDALWGRLFDAAGVASPVGADDDGLRASLQLTLEVSAPAIVVLDGVDRALPGVAALTEIIGEMPRPPRVLITSRRRPGLPGQASVDVHPLGVPSTAAAIEAAPASQLWLRRMDRLAPGRVLSASERADLVAVLGALDGLPLAIELAARRERLTGLAALRARLEASGAISTLDPLSRAFDPTWEALDESARTALADLTVFRGAFTLARAEEVLGPCYPDAAELVERLVDESCIQVETAAPATPTLRVLRLVREQVARRRPDRPTDELRGAHARTTVARSEAQVAEASPGEARRALEAEAVDLETAFECALDTGEPALAARALALLDELRWVGGASRPHQERIARLLPHAPALDPGAASALWETQARWRARAGEYDEAALEASMRLALETDDPALVARAARARALAASRVGRADEALAAIEEALARSSEIDAALTATCLRTQATLLRHAGRSEQAEEAYQRALDAHASIGDDEGAGATLAEWAMLLLELDRRPEAEVATERARRLLARQPSSYLGAYLDATWAMQAHVEGRLDEAVALHGAASAAALAGGQVPLVRVSRAYEALARFERGDASIPEVSEALDALRRSMAPIGAALDTLFALLLAMGGHPELARRQRDRGASVALPPSSYGRAREILAEATALALERSEGASVTECRQRARALLAAAEQPGDRVGDGVAEGSSDLRLAARIIGGWVDRTLGSAPVLHVARDGSGAWTERHGEVDLQRRPLLGRLLLRLAEPAVEPGGARDVSVDDLLGAGWPGESMVGTSGPRRLQVAISRLRELGLRDVVVTVEGGYAIDAAWRVVIAPS